MIDKIEAIFSPYLTGLEKNDFYELEIAAAGVMRGFMARHCDLYFTIERKVMRCLSCCFKLYEVPREAYMPALQQALAVDEEAEQKAVKTAEDRRHWTRRFLVAGNGQTAPQVFWRHL